MKARIFTEARGGLLLPASGVRRSGGWAQQALSLPRAESRERLHVMPVRGNVFMIVGAGGNIAVSAGIDGQVLVDAGSAAMADKVIETVAEIGRSVAGGPARLTTCVGPPCYAPGSWEPSTTFGFASPHVHRRHRLAEGVEADPVDPADDARPGSPGRTPKIAAAGITYNGGEAGRLVGNTIPATVIGQENILKRMTELKYPGRGVADRDVLHPVAQNESVHQRRRHPDVSTCRTPSPTATASCFSDSPTSSSRATCSRPAGIR